MSSYQKDLSRGLAANTALQAWQQIGKGAVSVTRRQQLTGVPGRGAAGTGQIERAFRPFKKPLVLVPGRRVLGYALQMTVRPGVSFLSHGLPPHKAHIAA